MEPDDEDRMIIVTGTDEDDLLDDRVLDYRVGEGVGPTPVGGQDRPPEWTDLPTPALWPALG